jgi:hypothetical protein
MRDPCDVLWLSGKPQVLGGITSGRPEMRAELGRRAATRLTEALRLPHGALAGY